MTYGNIPCFSMSKYVLIACEESQTECIEFRKLGAQAFSCDLQPCSGHHPEWHVQGDALSMIHNDVTFTTQDGTIHHVPRWSLIIAHPPCTYLTTVSAAKLYPTKGKIDQERFLKGVQAAQFFLKFYDIDFCPVCVENPMPFPYFGLPRHNDVVSPHLFGFKYSKRTYLWLKNLPPLFPGCINPKPKSWVGCRNSAKVRSKSFQCVAKAMAEQWFPII